MAGGVIFFPPAKKIADVQTPQRKAEAWIPTF